MKVQMRMNDIREAMYGMHKVTSASNGTPFHCGLIFLRARDNIELWVAGEKSFIRAEIKGEVIEEGAVAFKEKQFYSTVRKLNKHGGNLTVDVEDNYWLSCSTKELDFRMVGYHPDDFPSLPEIEGDWKSLDGLTPEDLELAASTASVDDARANLCGVHFTRKDGSTFLVSTDGHRLTKIELPTAVEFPSGEDSKGLGGFTMSREAAEVAAYILGRKKTGEDIAFGFTGDTRPAYMALKFDRYEVYGVEAEQFSPFPDYTAVLPTRGEMDEHRCIVDRDTMRAKVDATSLFSSPKTNNMRLTLDTEDGELEFYASDPDKGEGRTSMEVKSPQQNWKAGFNYKFLLEAIDAFETDELALVGIDSLSPTVFHVPGKPETLMVVMPMRL